MKIDIYGNKVSWRIRPGDVKHVRNTIRGVCWECRTKYDGSIVPSHLIVPSYSIVVQRLDVSFGFLIPAIELCKKCSSKTSSRYIVIDEIRWDYFESMEILSQ
jgi:hypothetical protein